MVRAPNRRAPRPTGGRARGGAGALLPSPISPRLPLPSTPHLLRRALFSLRAGSSRELLRRASLELGFTARRRGEAPCAPSPTPSAGEAGHQWRSSATRSCVARWSGPLTRAAIAEADLELACGTEARAWRVEPRGRPPSLDSTRRPRPPSAAASPARARAGRAQRRGATRGAAAARRAREGGGRKSSRRRPFTPSSAGGSSPGHPPRPAQRGGRGRERRRARDGGVRGSSAPNARPLPRPKAVAARRSRERKREI